MTEVHKRPDPRVVFAHYQYLEQVLPPNLRVSGLPISSWKFFIENKESDEVIAEITVDLSQIWFLWFETEAPVWAVQIAEKFKEKTGNPVDIYLP